MVNGSLKKIDFDVMILSDYNKRVLRGGLGKKLISLTKNKGLVSVVDTKCENVANFKGCTLICPNEKEAREIARDDKKELDEEELILRVKRTVESEYVIVTLGPRGMIAQGVNFHHVSTKAREVSDVTGAGDTVSCVVALCLSSGASIEEAATITNYAAGIVVEKPGTAILTRKELIERVETDG